MNIRVIKPGLLTTVQDMGRYGLQKYGVLVNGAMDTFSLRLANLLVGNPAGEAALEMTLRGPELLLPTGTLFSLTGAELSAQIDGHKVPLYRPIYILRDSVLRFGACLRGCRAYIAFAGGLAVPKVMGSKSTYLRAGIGGLKGRSLAKEDCLPTGELTKFQQSFCEWLAKNSTAKPFAAVPWFVKGYSVLRDGPIRATEGLQYSWFKKVSQEEFFNGEFQITLQSDRMGYRLQGQKLELKQSREMVSEPVAFGSIQITAEGQPIILLADRQTTGGYPKLAQIALCDLPLLAQRSVGQKLKFTKISLPEAEALYLEQEQYIEELELAIQLKLRER